MKEPYEYVKDLWHTYMSVEDICGMTRRAMVDIGEEMRQIALRHGQKEIAEEIDRRLSKLKETKP